MCIIKVTKETHQQVQLAAHTNRGGILYLPWFTILCITDTVIIGFLCLMSSVFFFLPYTICRQHIFQCLSVCWKACDSFLKDGIVCSPRSHYVTLWQQLYANVVCLFWSKWSPWQMNETQKQFTLTKQWPISTAVTCTAMSLLLVRKSALYCIEGGQIWWFYINIQKCIEDIYTSYQLNKHVMYILNVVNSGISSANKQIIFSNV